jgi:hypothetical protein
MKKHTTIVFITLPLVYLFWLSSLGAVEVYLNEVQITGAKDQLIEKAKIYLDKKGDVHISAPDYKVREVNITNESRSSAADANAPAAASSAMRSAIPTKSSPLQKNYFIVSDVSHLEGTGYSIKVTVNNKYITTLRDDIRQNILELNTYLRRGENIVGFLAVKPAGRAVKNALESDMFSLVLGDGRGEEGGKLSIENVLCEFKVRATETDEKSYNCTFSAQ